MTQAKSSAPSTQAWPRGASWLAVGILLLAGALRLAAALNDFWLDEIWSWMMARSLSSPWEVFTALHHDNNHHLNTLFLYVLGDQENWVVYRLLALITGTVAVASVALVCRDRVEAYTALVLFGFSYVLVLYSSEARGYGPAMLSAIVAFWALRQYLDAFADGPSEVALAARAPALSFGVATVLGFLSSLTFSHVYLGALAWSIVRCARSGSLTHFARRMLRLHALPIVFLIALYVVDLRYLAIGGGPEFSRIDIVRAALALTVGGPTSGMAAGWAAASTAVLLAAGLWRRRRRGSDEWIFFAVTVVVSPLLQMTVVPMQALFVRYLLMPMLFALLLLSDLLADLARGGARARVAYVAITGVILAGNLQHSGRLLQHGRGNYLEALRYMEGQTTAAAVRIGSDHDFRNPMVLRFYERYLGGSKPVQYFSRTAWPPDAPQWIVIHSQGEDSAACMSMAVMDVQGTRYAFEKCYPYAELSGWSWLVYRKQELSRAASEPSSG